MLGDDQWGMDCAMWRELISAGLDGELTDLEQHAAAAHRERCRPCAAFAAGAADLARSTAGAVGRGVGPDAGPEPPDLVAPVLAAAGARRSRLAGVARVLLGVVALVQLALAGPALVLGRSSGASEHVARHLGSFDVAIGIGLLLAALRPVRARPFVPIAAVLAACLAATALLDLGDGLTRGTLEAPHLVDLTGFALLWLVAGRPLRADGGRRAGAPTASRPLRLAPS